MSVGEKRKPVLPAVDNSKNGTLSAQEGGRNEKENIAEFSNRSDGL